MTGRTLVRVASIVALLAATAAVAFMVGRGRASGPAEPAPAVVTPFPDRVTLSPEAQADAGLTVEPARAVERIETLEATAVLALDETRTARIGSIVEGTVMRTMAEVGDRVRAGTLLAEMHSHVVHDTWADYRRAIADRTRLETELAYARDAEERAGRLLASRAISLQERERAGANRVAAEQQLDMARTEVRRSEEALEHLGVTNKEDPTGETGERIPARAPISGVVLERSVTQGTAVTPGMPLFVVSDLGALWALAEVDERHLARLGVGRPISVRVSAFGDEAFAGTIAFVADTVTEKTRRVVVRCSVPNPEGRLKPGMFATVSLVTGDAHRVIVVPSSAVQQIDDRVVVFVEQSPGTFVMRPVTLGVESGASVEVTQGVTEGDRVVTAGSFLLKSEMLRASAPDEG